MKVFSAKYMVLATLVIGLIHRAVQFSLVATAFTRQAELNPNWQSMQYLPADLLAKNFTDAMLYLQQTPPLPHLIAGILYQLTSSPVHRSIALIAFTGVLSCIAGALLILLLLRLRVWPPVAFVAALLFMGNSGVVLLEYTALGQCFYEQMAMVACLTAAIAAVSFVQHRSLSAAVWLGLAVAVLALTRATFSYFALPVIAWLLWQKAQPKYLLAFLLPVVLLHGGWAAKQYRTQGQWLWATSTWGGANAQFGDMKRGAEGFRNWQAQADIDCAQRWPAAFDSPSNAFLLFGLGYSGPDAIRTFAADRGPSLAARAVDLAAYEARGVWLPADSAGFREFSACLQQLYVHYWLSNPEQAISGWAKSYAVFWQPIDSHTAHMPTALVASRPGGAATTGPSLLGIPAKLLSTPQYFMRQEAIPWFISAGSPLLVPANVAVIPFAPQLATLLAFVMLHSLPLVAAYACLRKGSLRDVFPAGFSFLLLLYLYTAGICNLVEYKENMRFRLAIEPVIWSVGIVTANVLMTLLHQRWRQLRAASPRSPASQTT